MKPDRKCNKGWNQAPDPWVVYWFHPLLGMVVRRRPTLPPRLQGSTIGAVGLSFRVRNGTGRFPYAKTTVTLSRTATPATLTHVNPPPLTGGGSHVVCAGVVPVTREPHSGRVTTKNSY